MPFSSLGDLLDPRIEPRSPALQADSLLSEPPRKPLVLGTERKSDKMRPGRGCSEMTSVLQRDETCTLMTGAQVGHGALWPGKGLAWMLGGLGGGAVQLGRVGVASWSRGWGLN